MFLSPAENLDAMIAMQTRNKLGKSLTASDFSALTGKVEKKKYKKLSVYRTMKPSTQ